MGGGAKETAEVISTIFFVSGLNTLIQTTFGDRLPIIQGGSFAFLAPDPLKPDNLRWTQPQKWYALTPHSAQNRSNISEVRNQTMRPAMATMPSQSPFSAPPSRINKFSDISPNPRLIDGKKKKKGDDNNKYYYDSTPYGNRYGGYGGYGGYNGGYGVYGSYDGGYGGYGW